uniref:hypothetical protein n=1 Tax=Castellaniella defragrans TaxID=75697 RepID=UPI003341A1DD
MNYATGETVRLGDRVGLGQDADGEVVFIIDTGEYGLDYPESQWRCLKKGVMIRFPIYGLIHYEEVVEPGVKLIGRAAVAGKHD